MVISLYYFVLLVHPKHLKHFTGRSAMKVEKKVTRCCAPSQPLRLYQEEEEEEAEENDDEGDVLLSVSKGHTDDHSRSGSDGDVGCLGS